MSTPLFRHLPARFYWRTAQITARQLDRTRPRWWTEEEALNAFIAPFSPMYRRIWEELIRQRRGY